MGKEEDQKDGRVGKGELRKETKKNAIAKFKHTFPSAIVSFSRPVIVCPLSINHPPE
jgi:hypothetical protein